VPRDAAVRFALTLAGYEPVSLARGIPGRRWNAGTEAYLRSVTTAFRCFLTGSPCRPTTIVRL